MRRKRRLQACYSIVLINVVRFSLIGGNFSLFNYLLSVVSPFVIDSAIIKRMQRYQSSCYSCIKKIQKWRSRPFNPFSQNIYKNWLLGKPKTACNHGGMHHIHVTQWSADRQVAWKRRKCKPDGATWVSMTGFVAASNSIHSVILRRFCIILATCWLTIILSRVSHVSRFILWSISSLV